MKKKNKTEKQLDNEALLEEEVSIFGFIFIIFICLVVGVIVGYFLYKLAMNNTNNTKTYLESVKKITI